MIVQALHELQHRHGHLPHEELARLSERLGEPLRRLHEVASFFPHFRFEPPAAVEVRVCRDMSCRHRGSLALADTLRAAAEEIGGGRVRVEGTSCLGRCDGSPAWSLNESYMSGLPSARCAALLREAAGGGLVAGAPANRTPPGWSLDSHQGVDEYAAIRAFAEGRTDSEAILEHLKVANLRGMGGAGVPAARKWADVKAARGSEKYVVCNGDESEPGTFKDREILLRTPHLVVEGMILAGLIVGARKGIIYIRHEYPEQIAAVREAIARGEAMGVCGADVLGTGREFRIEVFVSPGGYICGEASALIEAIEDRRAEPRNKPPLLETNGLYDKPTVVNNVETLAWVPSIVARGGSWYRDAGRNGYAGLRLISISGDLNRPGVYEVPIGAPFRELIQAAGGVSGDRPLLAIATSGPSGGFVPAKVPLRSVRRPRPGSVPEDWAAQHLPAGAETVDLQEFLLDIDFFRAFDLALGAGIVVYAEGADLTDQALGATEFFRNESCGKCVPCRLGSQRLAELAATLKSGRPEEDLKDSVLELNETLELTSICGLGQVAGKPLKSLLTLFDAPGNGRGGAR